MKICVGKTGVVVRKLRGDKCDLEPYYFMQEESRIGFPTRLQRREVADSLDAGRCLLFRLRSIRERHLWEGLAQRREVRDALPRQHRCTLGEVVQHQDDHPDRLHAVLVNLCAFAAGTCAIPDMQSVALSGLTFLIGT